MAVVVVVRQNYCIQLIIVIIAVLYFHDLCPDDVQRSRKCYKEIVIAVVN